MGFVNEYVSDDDIVNFGLEELHKKWWGDIPPRFRYKWTIDRNRSCYYIPMRTGREESSNCIRGVFFFQGVCWDVEVYLEQDGSVSYDENPYRIVWGLLSVKHPEGANVPYEEIIPVLKEALAAYKIAGVSTPTYVSNIVTSFTF